MPAKSLYPLGRLRESRNLTQEQVVEQLKERGSDITSVAGLSHLEARGPRKYAHIRDLSQIYGVDPSVIEQMGARVEEPVPA